MALKVTNMNIFQIRDLFRLLMKFNLGHSAAHLDQLIEELTTTTHTLNP